MTLGGRDVGVMLGVGDAPQLCDVVMLGVVMLGCDVGDVGDAPQLSTSFAIRTIFVYFMVFCLPIGIVNILYFQARPTSSLSISSTTYISIIKSLQFHFPLFKSTPKS